MPALSTLRHLGVKASAGFWYLRDIGRHGKASWGGGGCGSGVDGDFRGGKNTRDRKRRTRTRNENHDSSGRQTDYSATLA
jgi:hypothetical protein